MTKYKLKTDSPDDQKYLDDSYLEHFTNKADAKLISFFNRGADENTRININNGKENFTIICRSSDDGSKEFFASKDPKKGYKDFISCLEGDEEPRNIPLTPQQKAILHYCAQHYTNFATEIYRTPYTKELIDQTPTPKLTDFSINYKEDGHVEISGFSYHEHKGKITNYNLSKVELDENGKEIERTLEFQMAKGAEYEKYIQPPLEYLMQTVLSEPEKGNENLKRDVLKSISEFLNKDDLRLDQLPREFFTDPEGKELLLNKLTEFFPNEAKTLLEKELWNRVAKDVQIGNDVHDYIQSGITGNIKDKIETISKLQERDKKYPHSEIQNANEFLKILALPEADKDLLRDISKSFNKHRGLGYYVPFLKTGSHGIIDSYLKKTQKGVRE